MSGPNLFERAKSIRMNGENWQNAIQRAKAQLKYETQLGGYDSYSESSDGGARRKSHHKKSKGRKHTEATKKRMVEASTGRHCSEETRLKMSKSMKATCMRKRHIKQQEENELYNYER